MKPVTNPYAAVGFTLSMLSLPIMFVPNLRMSFSVIAVTVCLIGIGVAFRRGVGFGLAISGLLLSGMVLGTAMTLSSVLAR